MTYRVMRIDPRNIPVVELTYAADVLTINVPQKRYNSGCPYFLRIDEEIPEATTIGSSVVIAVGAGTVTYPLLDCNGAPVTAENLRSGYSYPVAVVSSGTAGAFKLLAPLYYSRLSTAFSIDGTEGGGGNG